MGFTPRMATQQVIALLVAIHKNLTELHFSTASELTKQLLYCFVADRSGVFIGRRFYQTLKNTCEKDLTDVLNELFIRLPEGLNTVHEQLPLPLRKRLLKISEIEFEFKPTLIGSMIERVMDATEQSRSGTYHTSDDIISRTVNPLFLDSLRSELFDCQSKEEYEQLYNRICLLTVLDPAVGCGNFLCHILIALSEIEAEIIRNIGVRKNKGVSPEQLYGIELSPSSAAMCRLSLSVVHRIREQMICEAASEPLPRIDFEKTHFSIVAANSLRTDWENIISDVSYIVGNPPFIGVKSKEQREDIITYFGSTCRVDYCGAFVVKSFNYIKKYPNSRCAFVLTASVVQGNQAPIIWERLFQSGIVFNFAHQPFPWTSDAVHIADLHCVIIGYSFQDNQPKTIYRYKQSPRKVEHINAYLTAGTNYFLKSTPTTPLANIPRVRQGHPVSIVNTCKFCDEKTPNSVKYISADDVLNGRQQYVTFTGNIATGDYIIIPRHSSEKRKYIPMIFLKNEKIVVNTSCQMILHGNLFLFGLLNSAMHMAFTKQYCGRLGMRYRYSSDMIYNNFVLPTSMTAEQQSEIIKHAENILRIRQEHSELTLGDMYMDMPTDLDTAHRQLDIAVDYMYAGKILTDVERVDTLIKIIRETKKLRDMPY